MKNKINFHIDPDIEGVELMDAYFMENKGNLHTHDEFAIGVIEEGVFEHTPKYFHENYFVKGHIPLINPNRPHSGVNLDTNGTKYRMFYIQSDTLEKIANEINLREEGIPYFDDIAVSDKYLEQHLIQLHYSLFTNEFTPIQKQHYFYETFAYLIKNHSTVKVIEKKISPNRSKVNRVIDYLETYYDVKISLNELANIAELSPYYLNRIFAKSTGIAPNQYLIDLRLKKARYLLKQKRKVSEVALEVGFFDQSHFTRNFKRNIGLTPKQYQLHIS